MEKLFLQAAQGKQTEKIPLWLMRQAGRYLPEYMQIRRHHSTLTMFKTPAIASEITLQPLNRFPLSAAILYADILLIPDAMDMGLHFVEKEGPRFKHKIQSEKDLSIIRHVAENVEQLMYKLEYVFETIENVKTKLSKDICLIGFAGAPFTVASYMIEGGGNKGGDFYESKKLMINKPFVFKELMHLITEATIVYLKKQVFSGVEAIQLFESWSGALSEEQYRTFCLPFTKKIIHELKSHVPSILFLGQGAHLVHQVKEITPNVYSVDWRQNLQFSSEFFKGTGIALQGNLDPNFLYADQATLKKELDKCLKQGRAHPHGYIFNLGHGCTPQTPLENVEFLAKYVSQYKES